MQLIDTTSITEDLKEVDIRDVQSESDSDTDLDKASKPKKPKQRSYSIDLGDLSDNQKKIKGNITTNENDEEARVEFSVYRDYNNYCGGAKQLLYTNLTMIGFITTKVANDWLVGDWATSPDQHTKFGAYCEG